MEISLSILSIDYSNIKEKLSPLLGELTYLHLDIMDGHFVPNISFGPALVESLRKENNLIFDTHLMVQKPQDFIEKFVKAGSAYITFHIESDCNPEELIEQIHSYGISAGIAIKPETAVEAIEKYLPFVDMVLVMSVDPGFGGQKFLPQAMDKLRYLKKQKEEKGYSYLINVDGGINAEILPSIKDYTDLAVSGSYVLKAECPLENLKKLKNI